MRQDGAWKGFDLGEPDWRPSEVVPCGARGFDAAADAQVSHLFLIGINLQVLEPLLNLIKRGCGPRLQDNAIPLHPAQDSDELRDGEEEFFPVIATVLSNVAPHSVGSASNAAQLPELVLMGVHRTNLPFQIRRRPEGFLGNVSGDLILDRLQIAQDIILEDF
jgi:hypothetical protein